MAVEEFSADKLAKLRKEKGFTQTSLAKKINSCYTTIAKLERGEYCPSEKYFDSLCNALGVEPSALIGPDERLLEEVEEITYIFERFRKMAF
ncbi:MULTISPECIES: helix-turn-helix transcriptional regulator [Mesotoga]|uniref:helix-turn-helix domain-containing protein n=1 Tax=Mesotoga TaxID=1184396 RepID=UPI001D7F9088|nr:helix-turn-helix transcriptional regulator [Mesotoga sp.]